MKKFACGCEMKAGNISVKVLGGVATYKAYGFVYREDHPDGEYIVIQPADLRCSPVAKFPVKNVESLIVSW